MMDGKFRCPNWWITACRTRLARLVRHAPIFVEAEMAGPSMAMDTSCANCREQKMAPPRLECMIQSPNPPTLVPAPSQRDWMDATNEHFAYRCTPLSTYR
ncbi:DUF6065 family protein [Kaistia granuli]|uniref:DUF6065 family protein n=1 Tax=Kaistia granuli TaxID=363259 RepID=UPI00316ADE03